ncbi:protein of unknown function [Aminobacter niigataensis]|nr:protein of unknown function [Aminobacter niigataensis]
MRRRRGLQGLRGEFLVRLRRVLLVFVGLSQKIRKSWKKVVDSLKGWRLYTPQQRGRRAAGGPGVRF